MKTKIGIDEMKKAEEKTVKISFSVDELQGKSEEEIKRMIDDKLAKGERKSFFDYLMSLGEKKDG
jgi:hypothetical protein